MKITYIAETKEFRIEEKDLVFHTSEINIEKFKLVPLGKQLCLTYGSFAIPIIKFEYENGLKLQI